MEKLDPALALARRAYLEHRHEPETATSISVVVYYDGDLAPVAELGLQVDWQGRDHAIGTLAFDDLEQIAAHPSVQRIVAGMPATPNLDTAASEARARASTVANIGTDGLWHVAKPAGTLTAGGGATGAGVIVGIIDTGIDISHPAFSTQVNPYRSRILRVWDQGLTADTGAGESGPPVARLLSTKTYGVEYDTTAIDDAVNTSLWPVFPVDFKHKDCEGHGTHVAAIAAGGNQVAGGSDASFVGVAPRADIVAVKLLDGPDEVRNVDGTIVPFTVRYRDAVMYVLREAKSRGKPVVINASFGSSFEPGDGLDDTSRFLDDVFDPTSAADDDHFPTGAVYVTSAGNDGRTSTRTFVKVTIPDSRQITVPFELYDDRGASTRRTENCVSVQYVPTVSIKAWYREVAAPGDVSIAVRVPNEPDFSDDVFAGFLSKQFDGGKRRSIFHDSFSVDRPLLNPPGGTVKVTRNRIFVQIEPKKLPAPAAPLHLHGIYDLLFKGPPGTVLFVMGHLTGTDAGLMGLRLASAQRNGDPLPGPEIVNGSATPVELIDVTSDHTIFDAGGQHVIAAAAYDDLNSELAEFSSRGPLRDFSDPPLGPFAPKPDISGAGVKIKAALGQDTTEGFGLSFTRGSVEGNRFTEKSGTSMSAPMVSGIVALMLEKNPNLSVTQVRTALAAAAAGRPGTNPGPADPGYSAAFGPGRASALESHSNTPL